MLFSLRDYLETEIERVCIKMEPFVRAIYFQLLAIYSRKWLLGSWWKKTKQGAFRISST